MRFTILLLSFLACFGCADPSEKIINVTTTTGGQRNIPVFSGVSEPTYSPVVTEKFSVKVSDLDWRKDGGVWVGKPHDGWIKHKPADAEAVEAIEAYMNK